MCVKIERFNYYGNTKQQIIWLDDYPMAVVSTGAGQRRLDYIEPDHLGTPRVIIDGQRNIPIWQWPLTGEAFGAGMPDQDPDGDGIPFVFHLRYPGQRHDPATGLNYNYYRDYEPKTGRYIQSDPIGLEGGLNTYAYAGGNPIRFVDPEGLIAYICKKGNNIGIAIPIYFSGGSRTDHLRMAAAIEKFWSTSDIGNGYSLRMKVLIQRTPNISSNYVKVLPGGGNSWVYGSEYGQWYQTPIYTDNRDYAHEAGHLMGIGHNPSASLMDRSATDTSPRVQDLNAILSSKSNIFTCGC